MKRFSKIYLTLLAALAPTLTGCIDDVRLPECNQEEYYDGIVLRVPDATKLSQSMTRADVTRAELDLAENEGRITSLWFFAFDEDGDMIREEMDLSKGLTNGELGAHDGGYTNYDITSFFKDDNAVKSGDWRIYLVANVDNYSEAAKIDDIADEDAVKELKLHFYTTDGEDGEYRLTKSYIAENGLPMAALPADMQFKANGDDNYSDPDNDGRLHIDNNTKGVIHADLAFLCSKVRYTVLFDNTYTYDDSSSPIFEGMSFKVNGLSASNIFCGSTTVTGTHDSPGEAHDVPNLNIEEKVYPTNASDYPSSEAEKTNMLTKKESVVETAAQRAFQGVFYLPENLDADNRTTLNFSAKAINIDGSNASDGAALNYTMPLLPEENGTDTNGETVALTRDIERAHAYDIVARVSRLEQMDIQLLNVKDWDPKTISYALQLPTYLNVEKTAIEVKAGETTTFTYSSNAAVKGVSPKYGDKKIYKVEAKDGVISVSVDPLISESDFNNIMGSLEKYNYIHLVAGNITKKIQVTPDLKRFLKVGPTPITIDARERIASSDYNGHFEIEIETNVSQFTISDVKLNDTDTKASWALANPGSDLTLTSGPDDAAGTINFSSKNSYTFTTATATNGDNRLVLYLNYDNLNGGTFWQDSYTLKFKVSVPNTNYSEGDENYVEPKEVTVYIRPNSDNYTIYFKGDGYDDPHIYVYQCLELPSYLSNDYKIGSTYLRSMPVGYVDGTNRSASLEYSFTGAIAFKGWDSPINANALKTGGWETGTFDQGFYIFPGANKDGNWCQNFNGADSNMRYLKGESVDFCAAHRKDLADPTKNGGKGCTNCEKVATAHAGWPGIKMLYQKEGENAGWWKFVLSGVATPGKALIIFTKQHSTYDGILQYPGANQPGLVLFDFSTRVGYFNLDGAKMFCPDQESANYKVDTTIKDGWAYYRLKWKYEHGQVYYSKLNFSSIPSGVNLYKVDSDTKITTGVYDMTGNSGNDAYFDFRVKVEDIKGEVKWHVVTASGEWKPEQSFSLEDGWDMNDNRRVVTTTWWP